MNNIFYFRRYKEEETWKTFPLEIVGIFFEIFLFFKRSSLTFLLTETSIGLNPYKLIIYVSASCCNKIYTLLSIYLAAATWRAVPHRFTWLISVNFCYRSILIISSDEVWTANCKGVYSSWVTREGLLPLIRRKDTISTFWHFMAQWSAFRP